MDEYIKVMEKFKVDIDKRIDLLEAAIFKESIMVKEIHATLMKILEIQCRREMDTPWQLQKSQVS